MVGNPGQIDRYSTWEMDAMVDSIDPGFSFLKDTFFSSETLFTSEVVEHDIREQGRTVAPFVSPNSSGRSTRRVGYRTYQMKPAYIKLSDTVRPQEGFTRLAGEPYGGQYTPEERVDRLIAQQLLKHLDDIENRLELMAAEVLFKASLTIDTPDYPMSFVDFERNPNNAATAGVLWSNLAADPLSDIGAHAKTIFTSSRGAVVDTIVMTGGIWDQLLKFQKVRDLVNRQINISPGTSALEFGPRSSDRSAQFRGRLAGNYDVWTYDGYFEDGMGGSIQIMPQDEVLFLSNKGSNIEGKGGFGGRRLQGAILDMDAGIKAQRVFVKARNLWDPSGVEVLTQSAPMLSMRRPNAAGTLKVL